MLFCPLHSLASEGPKERRGDWFVSCFVCSGSDQVSWHWPLLPIRVLRKACLFAIWACGTKETMSAVSVRTGRFELKRCRAPGSLSPPSSWAPITGNTDVPQTTSMGRYRREWVERCHLTGSVCTRFRLKIHFLNRMAQSGRTILECRNIVTPTEQMVLKLCGVVVFIMLNHWFCLKILHCTSSGGPIRFQMSVKPKIKNFSMQVHSKG